MRSVIITLLLMVAPLSLFAAEGDFAKANEAYAKEYYNQALELYEKVAHEDGVSSTLYYNMANTYYRLRENGKAILYYERALVLDPGNSDARFNLDFVRSKAQVREDDGASYFSNWIDRHVSSHASDTWALVAVISFVLCLACVAVYFFVDNVMLRKVGFFGGAALLVLSVVSNVCAAHVRSRAVTHEQGIVMVPQATLSTSPRVPKDKSEEAFQLTVGYKVNIIDSIVDKEQKQTWLDVETGDSRRAWIDASSVARI